MSEWKTYRLEDAIEKIIDYRGKTPSKTLSGIPLVTAKVIKNGRIEKPNEFIAEEDYESWMRRGIPKYGDVVLTTEAPLGEVAQILTNEKIALAQRVITLRGKTGLIDNSFLKYFLVSPVGQNNLKAKETGSTVIGIKQSELRKVEIQAPDLSTQTAIAQILASLDDKIELNLQMNQTLEAMAQAIFKEWFVDFKFYGFDGVLENALPKGWQLKKLSDVIEIKHGYAFKGEFFSDFEEENILLTPGNFKIGGGFNSVKFKYYNGEIPKDYILKRNDLVVTMTDLSKAGDTLGYSALVPTIEGKTLLHNQRIGKIIFKSKLPLKFYLYWLMRQDSYRHFVLGSATGSTVKHTSPTRICEYEFILPDEKTLLNFETAIKGLTDKQQENEFQINNLTQTRDTLLPRLMSGKIKVKA